jgi:erythromycin esterase-like protein
VAKAVFRQHLICVTFPCCAGPPKVLLCKLSIAQREKIMSNIQAIAACAHVISGEEGDYDGLLEQIGDARIVLLGECTHGTQEFYHERARITQRLISECNFSAVAVEADWPDAYRVHRYVRGNGEDTDAESALGGFKRFPTWMWRNTETADLIDWLRDYNSALLPGAHPVGFYGLDLYSMFASIEAVLHYLDQTDPAAAARARQRYACFDRYRHDSQDYGYAAGLGLSPSCELAVLAQLRDMHKQGAHYLHHADAEGSDAFFYAQQNASLVANAEQYYRIMFQDHVASWNVRDRHMTMTLEALEHYLSHRNGEAARIVVWAHNSHLGDARATDVAEHGQWNVGQLVRQLYDKQVYAVGMSTYRGTVTAASSWNGKWETMQVRPALADSYEALLHKTGVERMLLPLHGEGGAGHLLPKQHMQRAIGVIYLPATELHSHYLTARLSEQFDAVLHIDTSHALTPLDGPDGGRHPARGEAPETFPAGV